MSLAQSAIDRGEFPRLVELKGNLFVHEAIGSYGIYAVKVMEKLVVETIAEVVDSVANKIEAVAESVEKVTLRR